MSKCISFSEEMVRAILEKRKSQTRRILKEKHKYYKIGDKLWVKERFRVVNGLVQYLADFGEAVDKKQWEEALFMPRQYSRIEIEIVDLREEHLQDIGEMDAKEEGVYPEFETDLFSFATGGVPESSYKIGFKHTVEGIYGLGIWERNPEVCVIKFKVIKPERIEREENGTQEK